MHGSGFLCACALLATIANNTPEPGSDATAALNSHGAFNAVKSCLAPA